MEPARPNAGVWEEEKVPARGVLCGERMVWEGAGAQSLTRGGGGRDAGCEWWLGSQGPGLRGVRELDVGEGQKQN